MAEVQPSSAPLSLFQQAQEEHQYNLFLLEQHRLAEGHFCEERASEEAVAAMAAANPNLAAEQHAIYDAVNAQASPRQEAAAVEVQL